MGLWLPQGVTDPDGTHEPARQKVCGACVGGDFHRKFGRRSRGREDPGYSFRCIQVRMLIHCAQVIRLEVLFPMGSRRCRESAVSDRLRLSACATSVPAHRASSIAAPSCVHVCERLGLTRRDHSLTHQRIIIRTFHLINAQILRAHPYPNPSRHPSPRRAWRRKLVFRAEAGTGRSPGDRTRSVS
jgi:hypothetical protein